MLVRPAIESAMRSEGAVAELMRKRLRKGMVEVMTSQLRGQPATIQLGGPHLKLGEEKASELLKNIIEFCADHLSVYGEYYKTKYVNR